MKGNIMKEKVINSGTWTILSQEPTAELIEKIYMDHKWNGIRDFISSTFNYVAAKKLVQKDRFSGPGVYGVVVVWSLKKPFHVIYRLHKDY
jgi:hypothetical protein